MIYTIENDVLSLSVNGDGGSMTMNHTTTSTRR